MISFTSIITTIKGLSLATKVGLGVGAVAVVAGGTAGTVAIINVNKAREETQIVADSPNDGNFPSKQEDMQIGEAGGSKDSNNEGEQVVDNKKPAATNDKPQATTQKPANSASSNNSQPTNGSSASKPSTSTAQPSQPSQPSAPSQPSQPAQPTQKPDYNLNDNYIIAFCMAAISGNTANFQAIEKSSEAATNACVAKAVSSARSHSEYAGMSDDDIMAEILGRGYSGQLTEALCSQYGLSCGRW